MKDSLYKCVISNSIALFSLLLLCSSQVWAQGAGPNFEAPVGITVGGANLFVVDERLDAVLQAEPVSGDRTVVSSGDVGPGPLLTQPVAIAVLGDGALLVVDRNLDAILMVDPASGNRSIISGCPEAADPCPVAPIGAGPAFEDPIGLAVATDGSIFVMEANLKALISVNMTTGDRTLVSSLTMGSGIGFDTPVGVATNDAGTVFITDITLDAVVAVDIATGNRTVVSGCMQLPDPCPPELLVGIGQVFRHLTSIASESAENLVVTDADLGAVIRLNTASGERTVLSDAATGTGPIFLNPVAIAVEPSGTLVVVDATRKVIIRVDPSSGDRTIVSSPLDLILSPPAGIYASTQKIDFAIIINREGTTSDFSVIFAGVDVTDQIMACGVSTPLPGGGMVINCSDVKSVLNLQPGRHRIRVAVRLTSGQPLTSVPLLKKVIWDLLD